MPELRRRSPLEGALADGRHGLGPRDAPGVLIAERRGLALVQVLARRGQERGRGGGSGLDPAPGRASETAGRHRALARARRVDGGRGRRSKTANSTAACSTVSGISRRSSTRATAARCCAWPGRARATVLAKGCRLDLHPRAFTPGMCAQTVIAQIGVLLHQCDEVPTYDLYVLRRLRPGVPRVAHLERRRVRLPDRDLLVPHPWPLPRNSGLTFSNFGGVLIG